MRIAVVKVYTGESGAASGGSGQPEAPTRRVWRSLVPEQGPRPWLLAAAMRTSYLAPWSGRRWRTRRSLRYRPCPVGAGLSAPLPQYPPSGRNRLPLLQHGGVAPLDDVGHRHPAPAVIPRTVRELRLRAPGHMAADLV